MGPVFVHRQRSLFNDIGKKGAINVEIDGKKKQLHGKPIEELKALLRSYRSPKLDEMPPFTGGAIGFLDMICCNIMRSCLSIQ